MFFRKRNKLSETPIITDIHSHLIPNIDDGPDSLEEALVLIKGLKELGFDNLWATSHVYWEYYPNEKVEILKQFDYLKNAVKEEDIQVNLNCSAEYYLDEKFMELLEERDFITFPDNYLLVETSMLRVLPYLEEYIFKIRTNGFIPILAHPERYTYMAEDLASYKRLKTMGCLFQMNLLSIEGYYGKMVKDNAKKLLKNNMIDLVGTDLHNADQLRLLRKFVKSRTYQDLCDNPHIRNNKLF